MNVLSLFDGMGCGRIALTELGITPDIYYASEIDKFAIAQSKLNFPDTIHLGSVTGVYPELLEDIDLLIGGSPCQSFSFAGKRVGMKTKENEDILTLEHYLRLKDEGFEFEGYSYLFLEYMRILTDIRRYNPDVLFLLENVEMGKKWEKVLTDAIGVPGIHINSAKVSAQNRKRIYWTNIPGVTQPQDRGILLRDILEDSVDEKYYLRPSTILGMTSWAERQEAKGNGFKMEVREGEDKSTPLPTGAMKSSSTFVKTDRKGNLETNQDKASCFTAGAHSGGNHSDMDCLVACASMVGRKLDENGTRADNNPDIVAQQRLELRGDEKTGCLTSVQKDNLLVVPEATKRGYVEAEQGGCFDAENPNSKTRRGRLMEDKSNSLMAKETDFMRYEGLNVTPNYVQWEGVGFDQDQDQDQDQDRRAYYEEGKAGVVDVKAHRSKVLGSARIRRLTPTECARLQTVPAWYKWGCSDTQQYKMLGNGWTIEVIKHIFSFIPNLYSELE